jgi:transcriptional regulator with GAF, ATPase, and Fis domain
MGKVKLRKLLLQKTSVAPALAALLDLLDPRPGIQDLNGNWLYGAPDSHSSRIAIEQGGETLGWVVGKNARHVAALVSAIAAKEAEKIALADEVLEKYRELNLLYNLSDKLATTLDLNAVAQITLTESSRLIRSDAGRIILGENAEPVAALGEQLLSTTSMILESAAARTSDTGKGEIVNAEGGAAVSLLCAPLKAQDRVIGVILLAREPTRTFSAEEFKLLATVASEAAPVIENAIQYERAIREAAEREERLKKQIEALQIQIDESRTARQVAEITETDYFQSLRQKADRLRGSAGA